VKSDRALDVKMTAETNLSITSIAGLTNNPNQTITGTGAVGATVKVLDGTTLLGTTVVGSDGTWSEVVALSGQGTHSISAQAVGAPTLKTLVSFDGNAGAYPVGGLVADAVGNLYGTTLSGGRYNWGIVFKLSGPDHQILTTLANFDLINGASPVAALIIDGAGSLYGSTYEGGTNNAGTIFKLSGSDHQTLSTLVNFGDYNVGHPKGGLLIDEVGDLFGTTYQWMEENYGTVFKLSGTDQHDFTTLVNFDSAVGLYPWSGLVSDGDGNLFGTTSQGGPNQRGTVFKLSGTDHQTLTTLVSFDGSNGGHPTNNLSIDGAGNLYGTTTSGGYRDAGIVFKLSGTEHQTLSTLVDFGYNNGVDFGFNNGG
jgi:uncharacterized repeat protein (TIGR03803 family)